MEHWGPWFGPLVSNSLEIRGDGPKLLGSATGLQKFTRLLPLGGSTLALGIRGIDRMGARHHNGKSRKLVTLAEIPRNRPEYGEYDRETKNPVKAGENERGFWFGI
jgi:hypothetical protein